MHPVLIELAGRPVPTYGIAIAVGFMVAIVLGARSARRQAVGVDRWLDLCFWLLIVSLLGSRLVFVVTHAGHYWQQCVAGTVGTVGGRTLGQIALDCSLPLQLWEGGLVYYGGLLAAVLFAAIYLPRKGLSFWRVADLATPMIALGHAIGRLGCYAAGCCYGKVSSAAIGARFSSPSLAFLELQQRGLLAAGATHTPALHPTQLYEAVLEAALCVALLLFNARKRQHGQTLLLYLMLYPVARSAIEIFRGDPGRRFVVALDTPGLNAALGLPPEATIALSTSQLISVLVFVAAALLWRARGRGR